MDTLSCTPSAFWQQFLTSVSPAVVALLSATALWVASRARGTSSAAQSTSEEAALLSRLAIATAEHNESQRGALDRRRSSTKGIISTSRGDEPSTGVTAPG